MPQNKFVSEQLLQNQIHPTLLDVQGVAVYGL